MSEENFLDDFQKKITKFTFKDQLENFYLKSFAEFHNGIVEETRKLLNLIMKGPKIKLKNFVIENYPKNLAKELLDIVSGEEFLVAISKIKNGFNSTTQKLLFDFYCDEILLCIKQQALYTIAVENLKRELKN